MYELNTNPALGPVRDGKQTIAVYDRALGNRRTIETSKEEVDEYLAQRGQAMKKASKKGAVYGLSVLLAGIISGVLVGLTKGKIKVNSITKAVNDCAPPVKGVIKGSIKQASFLGGGLGAIVGLFCPAIMAEKADKQVTNEFIERNK